MDQMSKFHRQTYAPNYQDVKSESETKRFNQTCLEIFPQLKINPEELTAENVRFSQQIYRPSPELKKLFPNYADIVTKEKELIIMGHTSGNDYNEFYYAPTVSRLRLEKFFREEWKDRSNPQHIEALAAYINFSKDSQAQKLLSTLNLSPDLAERIFNGRNSDLRLRERNNPFLVASFPQFYDTEEIESILKSSMISKTVPDYIGISEEQIDLRKRLDAVCQERLNISLHELKNDNFDRFQKLYHYERYAHTFNNGKINLPDSAVTDIREELWYEYRDRLLQTVLQNDEFYRLNAYDPDLTEEQSPRKQTIFAFLDQNLPPEKISYLYSNGSYMLHCLNNGTLADEKLQELGNKNENIIPLITSPDLTDRQARILFQAAAFNESVDMNKDNSVTDYETIRREYQRRYSENFDTLTNEQGQTRFQFLLAVDLERERRGRSRIHSKELLQYHMDELLKLPAEQILPYTQELGFSFQPDEEITSESNNLLQFEKIFQTYGVDGFPKNKEGNLQSQLTYYMLYLYREKRLSPDQTEILKESVRRSKYYRQFEPLFTANGETIYTVSELGTLIDENKIDSANLVAADGLKFGDDNEKYETLNNLLHYYGNREETDRQLIPYIREIFASPDFNIEIALNSKYSPYRKTLDFVLKQEQPDLNMLRKIINAKPKEALLFDDYYPKFLAAGLDIKFLPAEELVLYQYGREIELRKKDYYQAYDFNRPWRCEEARHPSDGSKTTFLNEMCLYRHAEGAAIALSNGANPDLAAEFMRGKYQKPPFQDLFIKTYFKKNATPSERLENIKQLRTFMLGIAAGLDEGKADSLKRVWKSLDIGEGRPLSTNPEIRELIKEVDQAYAKRDFLAEKKAKEEARRAEEQRIQAEKEARLERQRQEQERREKAEKERRHKEQLNQLNNQLIEGLGDLTPLDASELAVRMSDYLRENADNLPVKPNLEELENLKNNLLEQQSLQRIEKEKQRQKLIQKVESELRKQISEQEKQTEQIMSPTQIGLFAQEFYKDDPDSKSVLLESLKTLNEEAKERQLQAAQNQEILLINEETHYQVAKQLLLKGKETPDYTQYPKAQLRQFLRTIIDETCKNLHKKDVIKTFDDYLIGSLSSREATHLSYKFLKGENIDSKYFTPDGHLVPSPEMMKEINEEKKAAELIFEQEEKQYQEMQKQKELKKATEEKIKISNDPSALEEGPQQPVKGSSREEIKAAKKAAKAGKPETTITGLEGLASLKAKFSGNNK